jgi:hypothetical protein
MTPDIVRRFIRMPGVREVEDFGRFGVNVNKDDTRSLMDRCDALTMSLFGITRNETLYELPPEYADGSMPFEERLEVEAERAEYEAQFVSEKMGFDDSKVEYLFKFGWDLKDDRGQPLEITRHVCRTIEAVALGVVGTLPDADVVEIKQWEDSLAQEVRDFLKRPKVDRNRKG